MTRVVQSLPRQLELPLDAALDGIHSFDLSDVFKHFPRTRYQGSKRRLTSMIVRKLDALDYHTVLDAFGGTGSVAYGFKAIGKSVTYNDILGFNHQIGLALIENDGVTLDPDWADRLGEELPGVKYGDFIARTFKDIYFTTEENDWLDHAVANVALIKEPYARAIAWFAIFQAAMAKRPYNLFHRRNLYMRHADVTRGFGNKATWDRSFPDHIRQYITEANRALIDAGGSCRAIRSDALDVRSDFDLVYIDPPYVNARGLGVDYRDFYHFLEGMVRYDEWSDMLDVDSRHARLKRVSSPWCDATHVASKFRETFHHFRKSTIVVSYRSDGIPDLQDLAEMMCDVKRHIRVVDTRPYQYALSKNRRSREVLLIGSDQISKPAK